MSPLALPRKTEYGHPAYMPITDSRNSVPISRKICVLGAEAVSQSLSCSRPALSRSRSGTCPRRWRILRRTGKALGQAHPLPGGLAGDGERCIGGIAHLGDDL